MSKVKGTQTLPWLFSLSSGASFCLIWIFSDLISYYLGNNKILLSHYYLEIMILSSIITIRPMTEYISFVKYYNRGHYLFPGLCAIVSVLPYFLFYFINANIIYFYLLVTICSLFSLLAINRDVKELIGYLLCMAVLLSVAMLIIQSSNLLMMLIFMIVLTFTMGQILYKVFLSHE
ncbi:hypothetical protein EGH82_23505, partial [Vibrio ponticus]